MRRTPLLPVALALAAGILTADLVAAPVAVWFWAMAASVLLIGVFLLVSKRLHRIIHPLLMLFCIAVGGLLRTHQMQHDWTHVGSGILEVRLTETPVPRERSWRAKGTVVASAETAHTRGAITLFLRKDSTAATLRYGDRLLLHGYPDKERRYVYITSDHYIVTAHDSTSLRARSERLRLRLLRRMQAGPLEVRPLGMVAALTLGWRGDLDPSTQASFRDAGIAHLLAVSGLHVGLLAAIVGAMLLWLGKERRGRTIRGCVQLAAVWTFALLTGLAPSTTRAALMFSLFIVANITGRRTPTFNLLAAAAIVTLASDPSLLHDTGWQLSYSAVAGILLALPVIRLYRSRLWRAVVVSVAATLATLPVTLSVFHRIPVYFLIANAVIVPLAGVLLFFALIYTLIPCTLTALPLRWLITGSEELTSWVASLPGAVVEVGDPPLWAVIGLAVAVTALLYSCRFITKQDTGS